MIVSLFGPDGVGKSTVGNALKSAGLFVFNGTNLSMWPGDTWHKEFLAKDIDESSINCEQHFVEKIDRAHALASSLEAEKDLVVIDSDPLHKTMMHDYLRHLNDFGVFNSLLDARWRRLRGNNPNRKWLHVYLCVYGSRPIYEQAKSLQDRIYSRGPLAYFDPRTKDESLNQIKACRLIAEFLERQNEQIITVDTSTHQNTQKLISTITH